MQSNTGFHAGERLAQQRAGATATADRNATMVAGAVIGGARPFIAKQAMVALGSTDSAGRVWASLLFGAPGFAHTGDGTAIALDVPAAARDDTDPLWDNLAAGAGTGAGADVGMLFIELGSRRRYRVNGGLLRLDERGVEVAVREAYPNCPRYIQRRQLRHLDASGRPGQAACGTALHGAAAGIVARADTVFVASRHAGSGADVSHRGGNRGFVRRVDATTLRLPDYDGNSMFNTLGNLEADPRAGLCIPDFEGGRLLQLTGSATVLWDQDDPAGESGGTGRFWEFRVASWILRDMPQRMEWEYLDASPFNPAAAN